MSANEEFLSAFKSLESAVKEKGFDSVLLYEGFLEEAGKKDKSQMSVLAKIRLCRQVRNYIAHESQNFVVANKEMSAFLSDYAGKLSEMELPVKKNMEKKFVTDTCKVQEALAILAKRKNGRGRKGAPVLDKSGKVVGVFSYELVGKYLAKSAVPASTKVSAVMGKAPKAIKTVKEDTKMRSLEEQEMYLVKNEKGELTGWY